MHLSDLECSFIDLYSNTVSLMHGYKNIYIYIWAVLCFDLVGHIDMMKVLNWSINSIHFVFVIDFMSEKKKKQFKNSWRELLFFPIVMVYCYS